MIEHFAHAHLFLVVLLSVAYGIGAGATIAAVRAEGFRRDKQPVEIAAVALIFLVIWWIAPIVVFFEWAFTRPKPGAPE